MTGVGDIAIVEVETFTAVEDLSAGVEVGKRCQ
jgi:hypothetical protein